MTLANSPPVRALGGRGPQRGQVGVLDEVVRFGLSCDEGPPESPDETRACEDGPRYSRSER
jgi:hypothetical protein